MSQKRSDRSHRCVRRAGCFAIIKDPFVFKLDVPISVASLPYIAYYGRHKAEMIYKLLWGSEANANVV